MKTLDVIRCPLCGAEFELNQSALKCENGHSYDVASSGYVNLLPPGKAGNSRTGDDKNMIRARRTFLESGYYDRISDFVSDNLRDFLPDGNSSVILDAGCGEGYHITRIASALSDRISLAIGIDASKHGADIASKHARRSSVSDKINFYASNIFALPIAADSLDGLVSMFAPIPFDEAFRTLKKDGALCVVASGPRHLWELREILYEVPREGDQFCAHDDRFEITTKRELTYKFTMSTPDELIALYNMTPFSYKTSRQDALKLNDKHNTDMTVSIVCAIFKKRG